MPRCAALAFDHAGKKLIDAGFFSGEGVENSINAVELKRTRHLMGKGGSEVVHSIFELVNDVNMHVSCFRVENLSWRRRDGARWGDNSWLM